SFFSLPSWLRKRGSKLRRAGRPCTRRRSASAARRIQRKRNPWRRSGPQSDVGRSEMADKRWERRTADHRKMRQRDNGQLTTDNGPFRFLLSAFQLSASLLISAFSFSFSTF